MTNILYNSNEKLYSCGYNNFHIFTCLRTDIEIV